MKKRFITIFPQGQNVHLVKDVGMVPYMLQKEGLYDSTIAFYEEEDKLPYLNDEVKGLKYKKVKKIFNKEALNILFFLLGNFRNYDVVMFFHLTLYKLLIAFIIKILSFGRVKFYIKLDINPGIYNAGIDMPTIKNKIYKFFIQYIDVSTAETTEINEFLENKTFVKSKYLPNGFIKRELNNVEKEKVILVVARIGDPIKDHSTLLKALRRIDFKDWKVKIVGPIEKDFEREIDELYHKHTELKEKVFFTGNISDRQKLEEEYIKAGVFVLTSKYESFGIVLVEAISKGCYIVSTDLPSARDVTNNQKYGALFQVGDDKKLSEILQGIIGNEKELPKTEEIIDFANQNFDWSVLAHRLYNYLEK